MRITHHISVSLAALGCTLICTAPAGAQSTPAGSQPFVRGRDLAWLGGATALGIGLMQLDPRIARAFTTKSVQDNRALHDVARGYSVINEKSLAAAGFVTWAGARLANAPTASDVALHATEAIVISSAAGTLVRGVLGRSRPFVTADSDAFDYHYGQGFRELKYRSFPSIHSSAAFATAAVIATEMRVRNVKHRRVWTPVAYTLAAGPGLARMYGDKHWASDVFLGAALGTITGLRVAGWSHDHPGNRFDRWLLGAHRPAVGVLPAGVSVSFTF